MANEEDMRTGDSHGNEEETADAAAPLLSRGSEDVDRSVQEQHDRASLHLSWMREKEAHYQAQGSAQEEARGQAHGVLLPLTEREPRRSTAEMCFRAAAAGAFTVGLALLSAWVLEEYIIHFVIASTRR